MMDRRRFLKLAASVRRSPALAPALAATSAFGAAPAGADYRRLLILIELKGGNDGLNTLVPFADPAYYALRPKLAIARDSVVQLSDAVGLHPALEPLLPLWRARELAVLQGVGYPEPNLSHFRSIEIWDTASGSRQYLQDGWLTRTFALAPTPADFAADGVIIGSPDLGPLVWRWHARDRAGQYRAVPAAGALRHRRRADAQQGPAAHPQGRRRHRAGGGAPQSDYAFKTSFPQSPFGNAIRTACQVVANRPGVAVVRVTQTGYDTHSGQAPTQARLLGELAGGVVALKDALDELERWDDTLVLTYAEFGRRPKENLSNGTDHGTASAHFVARRARRGRSVRRASVARALVRRREYRILDRFSQRLRDSARPLVERPVDRPARRQIRAAAAPQDLAGARPLAVRVPGCDEFAPMRRAGGGELLARERQLGRVLRRGQGSAQQLKAQVDAGRCSSRRSRNSCGSRRSCPPRMPHGLRCRPCRACRESPQSRAIASRPARRPRLVHRQHVHQVEMPRVIAPEITVELELAVVVAPIPESAPR